MKRKSTRAISRGNRGSAMLAALCLATVFAISLSSYLALCYESLYISERNVMTTFRGSELAEAGVEQALYCINNNTWTGWNLAGSTQTANNMTMTASGLSTTVGATPLNFGNGVTGTVTVTVQNYNTNPSITSVSTLSIPSPYGSGSASSITSGTITYSSPTAPSTAAAPLFVNAVAAADGAVLFQSAGSVDSYSTVQPASALQSGSYCRIISVGTTNWTSIGAASNSVNTVFTATGPGTGTGTTYEAYNNTPVTSTTYVNSGYSAVVASLDNFSSTATVRLNNAVVHGYAVGYDYSSPSSTNWLSYAASGQLKGPNTSVATSIDSGRILTEPTPYQPIVPEILPTPNATLPNGSGVSSDGSTINQSGNLGNSSATVPAVFSVGLGISLSGSQTVTILGPVVLISYGGISISGTAKIALVNPQSSLQIFVEYGNISIGGTGITNSNLFPFPKKVEIIDTTNTWSTASIGTAQPFYGVVYLPYMPITVSNTGAGAAIYGAIIGQSVTFSGSPVLHYDLALRSPVSTTYTSATPRQYGAAFCGISAPTSYSSMVLASK